MKGNPLPTTATSSILIGDAVIPLALRKHGYIATLCFETPVGFYDIIVTKDQLERFYVSLKQYIESFEQGEKK